ncbi:hypothetical protein Glove_208g34 [Diversispora epigaea]|uniref:Uncharacterized protein n=1 Tax=Diversispora epigaea TaxID=1348612 RepID=A0A397IQM1_9GLOM|nr:hypothetical protein Glove_208g34 [Diversispora epigaea]
MEVTTLLITALYKLLNITSTSKHDYYIWTQQELLNICLGPHRQSNTKRTKVHNLLDRLVKKGLIKLMKTQSDNQKQEVTIYWIASDDISAENDIQEVNLESMSTSTSEPATKRISLGSRTPATPTRSMASIINKTRAKFSGISPNSTTVAQSLHSPLGKRTPISLSKKSSSFKSPSFKSPLVQTSQSPEIKTLIEQKRQLEKDIENAKDNIRKRKLLLTYQEKDEEANNEELIKIWRKASQEAAEFLFSKLPKQSSPSFLNEAGFSNSWGNKNWGWEDDQRYKQRENESDQELEDCDGNEYERVDTEQKDTMKYMLTKMGIGLDLIKWNENDECFEE